MQKGYWNKKSSIKKRKSETTGSQYLNRPIEIKEIKKYAKGKTLDVGCGSGYVMGKLNVNVIGIDTSRPLLKMALKEGHNVKYGSATKIPFPNNTFDTVYTVRTIINLNSDEQIKSIDECYRVLKPGGRLLLYEGVQEGVNTLNKLPFVSTLEIRPFNKYLNKEFIKHLKKLFIVKKVRSYPVTNVVKNYLRTFFSSAKKNPKNLGRSYIVGKITNKFDSILSLFFGRYSEFNLFVAEKKR